MATLKLKTPSAAKKSANSAGRPQGPASRPPVRGAGNGPRHRPTLAEAQAQRAEREALWQQENEQRPRRAEAAGDSRAARPGARPSGPGAPGAAPKRQAARPEARPGGDPRPAPRRPSAPTGFESTPREAPRRPQNTAFGQTQPQAPAARPARRDERAAAPEPRTPPAPKRLDPAHPAPRDRERSQQLQQQHARGAAPRPRREEESAPAEHAPGSMRLSKRMSELGLASRREADEWIEKGWVRVDGQVVRELGSRVVPGQRVTIDAPARQMQAKQVTVLLNKPIGYVSGQAEDGYEPAFVLVMPQNQWTEDGSGVRFARDHLRSLVPAGRLDIDSTGLLVLTQDGRVAKTLIGENSPIEKEYLVRVQSLSGEPLPQALSPLQLAQLNHGLELDGQPLQPAKVEWVNEDQLRFVLVEGKKRQIRRMCEAVGLKVTGLKRVRIGRVMLGDLPVGQWRYLRGDEAF
jgi:23S rRNA pseudouridine2604 synthase